MIVNVVYIFIPNSGALIQKAVSAIPWDDWGKSMKNLSQGRRLLFFRNDFWTWHIFT